MNPYETLGLSPGAGPDEAEAAYHQQLRRCHPDLHHGSSAEEIAAMEAQTQACNDAIERIRRGWRPRPDDPAPRRGVPRDGDPTAPGSRPPPEPATAWEYRTRTFQTDCPLCGIPFAHLEDLARHARDVHHVHLERRPRRARRRRSRLGLDRLTLWVLAPLNAIVAITVATVSLHLGAADFAAWVFALVMAPTFIRLATGSRDRL